MLSAPRSGRRRAFWRAARDRRGVSALEFALIAPLFVLVLLGVSDVVPVYLAGFNFHHAVESVGDIAAEYTQMQTSDMANVFASGPEVIAPFSSSTLALRITEIYSNGASVNRVYWSCGQGSLSPYTANSVVTSTPTGAPITYFLPNNDSMSVNTAFIMVEGTYTFTPITQFVITQPQTMTTTAYLMPRSSSYVGFPWDGVSTDAPTAPNSTTKTATVTLSNGAVCNYAT